MTSIESIPVLIPAYNKPARLAGLITSCIRFGLSEFWISIDGPKTPDVKADQIHIWHFISDLQACNDLKVCTLESKSNLGGPRAVPRALEWFFNNIKSPIGLVLEEDLQLVRDPKPLIQKYLEIKKESIVGGSLFTASEHSACSLVPLFEPWGWFMTPSDWQRIRRITINRDRLESSLESICDSCGCDFWLSIFDKIYRGDPFASPLHWDYDIYIRLLQERLLFIHPPSKFCINHGYGAKAQNTCLLPVYATTLSPMAESGVRAAPLRSNPHRVDSISDLRHYSSGAFRMCTRKYMRKFFGLFRLGWLYCYFANKKNQIQSTISAQKVIAERYRGQIPFGESELKLNIGAGDTVLPGYVRVDGRGLLGQDVVQMSPYVFGNADSITEIYCSHLLEHFPRSQFPSILSNFYRMLKPGGTLRIAVPDFAWFVGQYSSGVGLGELLAPLFGGQNYDFNYHMNVFDRNTLHSFLLAAGFTTIEDWSSRAFFENLGCTPDFSSHPCSLNLLAKK